MAQPSPSYTVALRLQVPRSQASVAQLVDTAASTGAIVTGVDVDDPSGEKVVIDLTMDLRDSNHRLEVIDLLKNLPGVEVETVGDSTFLAHIGGKIEIAARTPIRNRRNLSRVYTPGVARVARLSTTPPPRPAS